MNYLTNILIKFFIIKFYIKYIEFILTNLYNYIILYYRILINLLIK